MNIWGCYEKSEKEIEKYGTNELGIICDIYSAKTATHYNETVAIIF